jgi:site-specific recombinase XerD
MMSAKVISRYSSHTTHVVGLRNRAILAILIDTTSRAGAELLLSHSLRVTTITYLLEQGVPLEDAQRPAGHADPRTTGLYDRRKRKITRNIVERISV